MWVKGDIDVGSFDLCIYGQSIILLLSKLASLALNVGCGILRYVRAWKMRGDPVAAFQPPPPDATAARSSLLGGVRGVPVSQRPLLALFSPELVRTAVKSRSPGVNDG